MIKTSYMILSSLYIGDSYERGRGVFSSEPLAAGTVIEISPVIVMGKQERVLLDKTLLHDYIFEWGQDEKECCMALGYLSLYNHDYRSNAEYVMDFALQTIRITTVRYIKKDEEIFINYNGNWNNPKKVWFDKTTP
jgi:SET domain-containing protein